MRAQIISSTSCRNSSQVWSEATGTATVEWDPISGFAGTGELSVRVPDDASSSGIVARQTVTLQPFTGYAFRARVAGEAYTNIPQPVPIRQERNILNRRAGSFSSRSSQTTNFPLGPANSKTSQGWPSMRSISFRIVYSEC